jgi:hypothetical protein
MIDYVGPNMVFGGYDLNVWDSGLHNETDSQWEITAYHVERTEDYTNFNRLDGFEVRFFLTAEEAHELTLGWGPELGGDYTNDVDFWIDPNGFLDVYKNIPSRVREFVELLKN